jgi:hypothetical protein
MIVFFAKYNQNGRVQEDVMGRTRSTWGGRRGMHIGFLWESQKEKRALERPRRKWEYTIKMDLIRDRLGW